MSAASFQLNARLAVFGIAWLAVSGSADSGSSPRSINDDAAIFRQYANLKAELQLEAEALQRDTGVITLLKTVAFITGDTAAGQARQLAEAASSSEQPVAAILYVRGNRSAGIGTNASFDAIVPAFELASLPSQGEDENSNAAEQIADTYRRLFELVRRYTHQPPHAGVADSHASAHIAERWLLVSVMTIGAAIVGTCAWCSRQRRPVN